VRLEPGQDRVDAGDVEAEGIHLGDPLQILLVLQAPLDVGLPHQSLDLHRQVSCRVLGRFGDPEDRGGGLDGANDLAGSEDHVQ